MPVHMCCGSGKVSDLWSPLLLCWEANLLFDCSARHLQNLGAASYCNAYKN